MAAMSATHTTTTTTLTPPSSSHGDQSWNYSASGHTEVPMQDKKAPLNNENANRGPLPAQNGHASQSVYNSNGDITSRRMASSDNLHTIKSGRSVEASYLSPPHGNGNENSRIGGNSVAADGLVDVFTKSAKNGAGGDKRIPSDSLGAIVKPDDGSKWIHRDKLARIESEELQAAGIILPKQRAPSKPRRDHRSNDALNGFRRTTDPASAEQSTTSSRKNSVAADQRPQDITVPSWDFRLPEEIAAEANSGFWTPNGLSKGASRIPVAKLSPVPIPLDYLERESPVVRKPTGDGAGEGDTIAYPKPRPRSASMKAFESSSPSMQPARRSATDVSPKKGLGSGRKLSTRAPAGARPKTRSGPNKDSTSSSGTRPSTRSGELSAGPSKHPEGDPPWMVSAYQPDPRLPPEQQLLPTVARRLQQEKWEKEGKFGNVYDKEFRPLNDDPFLQPPEAPNSGPSDDERLQDEWPLRAEGQRSPGLKHGNSYSTMPKIQDKPTVSPVPSPRGPMQMQMQHQIHPLSPLSPLSPQDIVRVPEQQEEQQKRSCGCCVVM